MNPLRATSRDTQYVIGWHTEKIRHLIGQLSYSCVIQVDLLIQCCQSYKKVRGITPLDALKRLQQLRPKLSYFKVLQAHYNKPQNCKCRFVL